MLEHVRPLPRRVCERPVDGLLSDSEDRARRPLCAQFLRVARGPRPDMVGFCFSPERSHGNSDSPAP
eukprot:8281711-Lingulodinium_polyedra.AAC.1